MERSTGHRWGQCLHSDLGVLRDKSSPQGDDEPPLSSFILYRRSVVHAYPIRCGDLRQGSFGRQPNTSP